MRSNQLSYAPERTDFITLKRSGVNLTRTGLQHNPGCAYPSGSIKSFFPSPVLDQFTLQKESRIIRHARGLLYVVRNQDDGVFFFQVLQQIFDSRGGNGVQRRGRLIQHDHFRLQCQHPRQAQALLLPARNGDWPDHSGGHRPHPTGKPVAALFPRLRPVSCGLLSGHFQPVAHILVNGQWQRHRAREYDPDLAPQPGDIQFRVEEILFIETEYCLSLL